MAERGGEIGLEARVEGSGIEGGVEDGRLMEREMSVMSELRASS